MKNAALALGLAFTASSPALAAGGDEKVSEVIDVTTPAGSAARPELRLRLERFKYDLQTQDLRFPSGLRVMFQRDPSQPVVAITAVTDHGSSDDPEGREGIAHLVEHLWFRSEHGELPKVWDLLEAEMGCSLNAFTQYDITAYMTVCASHNLEPMMGLESLRMTDTVRGVTQDMVTTEIEVVRNEIRMRSENFNIPFFTVWEYVNKHMFPEGHPYHRPIAGDHTTIRNCRLEDIQTFTDDYYTPSNTTIMVVGDIPSSDFGYLVDLVVRTFDLELLDPNLKAEHLRRMPKPGVTNPNSSDPNDYYMIPMNPKSPDTVLPIEVTFPPRAAEFSGLIPPDPVSPELGVYEGPVKDATVAVSWTLPAGYQGQDTLLQITGGILNGFVGQGLRDSGGNYIHPDIKEFEGCGALPSKLVTTVVCTATMKDADGNAEAIAGKIIDQIAELTNAEAAMIGSTDLLDLQLSRARNEFLVGILNSVDLYAAVGAGRATEIAQYAHFTGSVQYFKDSLNEVMALKAFNIRELADKWLKRKRASMVLIKPMERDEVAILSEDTEGSGGHFRGGGEASILKPSIDPEMITPEFLRGLITLPDLSKVDDITLPNGLRVVVVPHGEAPLINAWLIANGGSVNDTTGIDMMARRFQTSDAPDPLQIAGGWSGGVGDESETLGIRAFAGNLDGALWMLRTRVDTTRPYLSGKTSWINSRKKALKKNWKDEEWLVSQMRSEHLNPGHPLNASLHMADYDRLNKANTKTLDLALKQKWQPGNATLLIVGNLDPAQARAEAIKYFGGWRAAEGVKVERAAPVPGPNPAKDMKIVVVDDEGKTQTQVTLACPLKPATSQPSAAHALLGDIARMTLFAELREEAGVVYSPQAGVFVEPGGTATMFMTAAIQNDSAGFALKRYFAYLEDAAAGKLSETDLRIKKLSRASGYVINQQSLDQLTSRLSGVIERSQPWSTYETYADQLANVTLADLAELTQGCADHAFVNLSGPIDTVKEQLDKEGFTYEVLDPKALGNEIYEREDPKGYAKYLKQKEKDDAKKAKSGESSEGSDDEDEDEDE